MTTETPAKPHVSASSIESYLTCGHYVEQTRFGGKKPPRALAALRGTAIHAAAGHNYAQKLESREDIPQNSFIDYAVAQFDGGMTQGVYISREDESIGVKKVVGKARDEVADLSRFHIRSQAPEYQPIFIEQRFRLELPGTYDLVGIIDIYDERGICSDFKTRSKRASQAEADNSPQLTIYAAGVHALTGAPPKEVALDVTINMASRVDRQFVTSTRDERDFDALGQRIDMVTRAMDAGIFLPAPAGSWKCSSRWCPLWNECRYVNSERIERQQRD